MIVYKWIRLHQEQGMLKMVSNMQKKLNVAHITEETLLGIVQLTVSWQLNSDILNSYRRR